MANSQFGGPQLVKNRASGYTHGKNGFANANYIDMNWPHATGSLVSTVGDLILWNPALMSGKVVSIKSYQTMISPFTLNVGSQSGYGYGLSTSKINKFKAISHGGRIPGISTYAVYFPEQDIFIAALSNNDTADPTYFAYLITAELLDIKSPQFKPVKIDKLAVKEYMGEYHVDKASIMKMALSILNVMVVENGL